MYPEFQAKSISCNGIRLNGAAQQSSPMHALIGDEENEESEENEELEEDEEREEVSQCRVERGTSFNRDDTGDGSEDAESLEGLLDVSLEGQQQQDNNGTLSPASLRRHGPRHHDSTDHHRLKQSPSPEDAEDTAEDEALLNTSLSS